MNQYEIMASDALVAFVHLLSFHETGDRMLILDANDLLHNLDDKREVLAVLLCASTKDTAGWLRDPSTLPSCFKNFSVHTAKEHGKELGNELLAQSSAPYSSSISSSQTLGSLMA